MTARFSAGATMLANVPLIDAELCWNDGDEGGAAAVIAHSGRMSPAEQKRVALYDNAVGACFGDWAAKTDDRRLAELLRDAFLAVTRDGSDGRSMTAALLLIPEFRSLLHPGDVSALAHALAVALPDDQGDD